VAVASLAVTASLRPVNAFVLKMQERVDPIGTFDVHIAAAAAVAAAGSAARDKLFPSERHAAVAAVPGNNPYFRAINKQNKLPNNFKEVTPKMVPDGGRDKSRPYNITIRNPKSARRAAAQQHATHIKKGRFTNRPYDFFGFRVPFKVKTRYENQASTVSCCAGATTFTCTNLPLRPLS